MEERTSDRTERLTDDPLKGDAIERGAYEELERHRDHGRPAPPEKGIGPPFGEPHMLCGLWRRVLGEAACDRCARTPAVGLQISRVRSVGDKPLRERSSHLDQQVALQRERASRPVSRGRLVDRGVPDATRRRAMRGDRREQHDNPEHVRHDGMSRFVRRHPRALRLRR